MQKQKEFLIVGDHTFQLVDFVPFGYEIWNIGKNMPKDYLPLCRLSAYQPFPGGRNIEVDTLKAIKIKGAQLILDAIGYGAKTIEDMERYIASHRNAKPGTCAHMEVQLYKKALPVMRQIKWHK